MLPEALRDETGVIFASAFPGGDRFADEFTRYYACESRLRPAAACSRTCGSIHGRRGTLHEIERRIAELREALEREPYAFDRRFLFRILAMGHSQFAEYIGARGPEHAGQRGLRQHGAGDRAGRGLDPRGPLPARDRDRRRRRDRATT